MKSYWFSFLIVAFMVPDQVLAHARLRPAGNLPPRSTNAGIKTGPCGGLPRSANPTVLQKGSTITVSWEETINHPGRFEFYFSLAGDTGWQLLKSVPDDQNGGGLPHQFSTTLTLPDVDCTGCTIQMIQVMTENPASPSLYYSCADIVLQTLSGPVPPPVEPPPSPNPDPVCH